VSSNTSLARPTRIWNVVWNWLPAPRAVMRVPGANTGTPVSVSTTRTSTGPEPSLTV
jgi:hypothetical protein